MDERYRRGLAVMRALDGDLAERLAESLDAVAPDFLRCVVEFAFGDICARPALDLKTREIATVAALAALGTAPGQLKTHLRAALNVGCSPAELTELLMQMAVYAGFPAALNGLAAAREVFAERAPEGA